MITQIPSTKLPHLNVFHAVSLGYWQGTITFAFIPQLEGEACTMVAVLLPFIWQTHGDDVFKFFTPAAGNRALNYEWDSITIQIFSPNDQAVQDAMTPDEEYHFEPVEIIMPPGAPAPTGGTAAFAQNSDSVSTFRLSNYWNNPTTAAKKATKTTKKGPTIHLQVASSASKISPDKQSRGSHSSALTMETLQSKSKKQSRRYWWQTSKIYSEIYLTIVCIAYNQWTPLPTKEELTHHSSTINVHWIGFDSLTPMVMTAVAPQRPWWMADWAWYTGSC